MRRETTKPDINVTPLVDVVLVLLIIFMVVTPQMDKAKNVDVPAAHNVDGKTDVKVDPLKVSVTKDGQIWVEDQLVDEAQLKEKLSALFSGNTKRRLVVKADRAARYGVVERVFSACQNAGFIGVALEVKQRSV